MPKVAETERLKKANVQRAFDQASSHYDQFTQLQRDIGDELIDRLRLFKVQPQRILDVGAGTGRLSGVMMDLYPKAQVTALDLAPGMLKQAAAHDRWRRKLGRLCGDAECLPVADASVDLVFSNLAIQWCQDLDAVFAEFKRVLRPGGMLLFSSFGPSTLHELRESWAQVDNDVHVNRFVDLHEVGDAMLNAGLPDPVVDVDRLCLHYPDVYDLMRGLKGMGAHNVNQGRAHGLTPPRKLKQMLQAYEAYREQERLPATFEVVYGHAWMAAQGEEVAAGSQSFSLSRLLNGG